MTPRSFPLWRVIQGAFMLCLLLTLSLAARANPGIFADGFETPCTVPDTDSDGLCDAVDPDDDGDGVNDWDDDCPLDPNDGCGPPNPCDDPRVQPAGLFGIDRSWDSAWSSTNGRFKPVFPNSPSGVIALGANVGTFLSVGRVYPENLNVVISWDQAQPNNQYGYSPERVNIGGMFVGFSPCRGDFRPTDPASPFWWLRPACRRFATAGGITLTTKLGLPAHICYVPPATPFYMTVSAVDPSQAVLTDTCSPPTFTSLGLGCDVQALHRGTFVP